MSSIFLGLLSAFAWGAADFCGGLASRKTRAYQAAFFGETAGLLLLLGAVAFHPEALPDIRSGLLCAIAGSLGVIGLLLFFQSMRQSPMSIAAPLTALTAAILPVIAGIFIERPPSLLTLLGFALALGSIWFISQGGGESKGAHTRLAELGLPLLAGFCFGVYFILFNRGSQQGLIWPMVVTRTAGVVTILVYALAWRKPLRPEKPAWLLMLLNGILDVTGNGFYLLAGQAGRMDVAAVLSSLYPGSTVILAWLLLHEKLNRLQRVGILTALAAIVFLTISLPNAP